MSDITLELGWLEAFRPPPVIAPSAFAEAQIVLPASSNAQPGPLRLASYQREIVDSIAADDCEIIILMLSSQVGKSLSVDAMMAHVIANDPGPALHVSPTAANAEKLVRNRVDPLIAASPALRNIVGKGQATRKGSTGGADNLVSKSFPGGQLDFASSFKADELAARAIRFLFLDEVDRFAKSVGVEGDPISLALKRSKTFQNAGRKIVIVSTPTSRVGSRVAQWFERGDKRRFMVACPDCGDRAPLAFENLKWEEGKPNTATIICAECGCIHDERARRKIIEAGEWVATAQGEPGIRSYHLNELASKFSTLSAVAAQAEAAVTPEQKQAFHNTTLAETYDSGVEVELNASELQMRAVEIEQPYKNAIQFVTAGVDVQGNRLECTLLGHTLPTVTGHAGQAYVLNHIVMRGDTSADAVWHGLDAALAERFTMQDGRTLAIAATAVDSGFSADQVIKFVDMQRRARSALLPYQRRRQASIDQRSRKAAKLKGVIRLMLVGVDGMKLSIAKRLALTDSAMPGYIHLPSHICRSPHILKASHLRHFTAKTVRGFNEYKFTKIVNANEALDAIVYATAIANAVPKSAFHSDRRGSVGHSQQPLAKKPTIEQQAAQLHAHSLIRTGTKHGSEHTRMAPRATPSARTRRTSARRSPQNVAAWSRSSTHRKASHHRRLRCTWQRSRT